MANPHPAITFRVNLETPNLQGALQPDSFQEDKDNAQTVISERKNYRNCFLPTLTGKNVQKNHDDTFTLYGLEALQVKATYTTGTDPVLVVVE